MNKISCYIILISLIISPISKAESLRDSLYDDIDDGTLDSFSPLEAAFIISGTASPESLEASLNWFNTLKEDIESKRFIDVFDKAGSAEKLFQYLHATWLKKYKKEATTLLDIKNRKEFNCVSATILYNLTCDELGLGTMAFETPTHVYTIFTNFGHHIMVENTTTMGFNIIKNLANYSQYMSQYYPESEIYKIGLHRLYAYENSRGRTITNIELLGLICYNQAYLAAMHQKFDQAYEYVLLAQRFNQDSRSNQKFEINLYYNWGKQLFEQKKFYQAFEIFADASYRYPDNKDFERNCISAFLNSLQISWNKKDWNITSNLIYEVSELDILSDKEILFLKDLLTDWIQYFRLTNDQNNGSQANQLLKEVKQNF